MRQNKFRQYNLERGVFTYWGWIDENTFATPTEFNGTWLSTPNQKYTGLKDKNGKEIWEGDILKDGFAVEWQDNACRFNIDNTQTYEVVGNIYENPELLK